MNNPASSAASSRAVAARAVLRVFAGKSFDDAFANTGFTDARDLAFAKALAYGVLREHSALSWLLTRLLSAPLLPSSAVHALLCVGLHQLRSLNTAAHAAVSATVDAVEPLGEAKARGLVNAILRRYQRESVKLEDELPTALTTRYSHPVWLVEKLHADRRTVNGVCFCSCLKLASRFPRALGHDTEECGTQSPVGHATWNGFSSWRWAYGSSGKGRRYRAWSGAWMTPTNGND